MPFDRQCAAAVCVMLVARARIAVPCKAFRVWDLTHSAARLLHPAVQALLLGVLATGLVLLRKPRAALVAALVAAGWIGFASTPWLALTLRESLLAETPAPLQPADAIVVLGGGKLPVYHWLRTNTRAGEGFALWHAGLAPVLLVSGSDQAVTLARELQAAGIPPGALRVEAASTNTHENAHESAALLRAEGRTDLLLVTSAIHMQRAAGAFRHEGLRVVPAVVDEEYALLSAATPWVPRREALTLTARCLREHVALWLYRRRGWI